MYIFMYMTAATAASRLGRVVSCVGEYCGFGNGGLRGLGFAVIIDIYILAET